MSDLCNCSTCSYKNEYGEFPFEEPCPLSNYNLLNKHDIVFIVERIGCLSHSNARGCLMQDAIKKLEMAIKTCDNPDRESAYDYAIDIIRGE